MNNQPTIEIKVENVKGIIKHYEMMLKAAKTDVQKEFYTKQIEIYKSLISEELEETPANEIELDQLNENDSKTLEACKKDLEEWKNKIFKVEIDKQNNQIKVISKRRVSKGKGFIIPLFEELTTISSELLEKYIYSKYTTEIYLHM